MNAVDSEGGSSQSSIVKWADLTDGATDTTIKFNFSNPLVKEQFRPLGTMLAAAGCLKASDVGTVYNLQYEMAVKTFQDKNHIIPSTGILDDYTFSLLYAQVAEKMAINKDSKDQGNENGTTITPFEKSYNGDPRYTPFFNSNNSQKLRNTNLEIRIDFGANHPLNKVIKHVFLRSLGVDVDASGNPLYKVYEFIGQDVEENDVVDLTKINDDGTNSKVKQTVI